MAVKLSIQSVFKIFGADPAAMMAHVRAGMDKATLLARHRHVMGLNDINVDVESGRITVIMGLSGSGKSTLIRHLNRLIEPTAGQILLDGSDIMALSPDALRDLRRQRMSMVFQNFALMPHRTVAENAATVPAIRGEPAARTKDTVRRWLRRLGLEGYESYLPHQLSGGMQQRVGIARALCSEAEVMLMDEAFSALDPIIRIDMQNLLLDLQQELHKTIVFITHDLDEALRLADHLVVLKDGAIVQQGKPQDIVLNPVDDYIEDFLRGINRARALRVRSVMAPLAGPAPLEHVTIDAGANLEDALALSAGDVSQRFLVLEAAQPVGILEMSAAIRALVPRRAVARSQETRTGDGQPHGRALPRVAG